MGVDIFCLGKKFLVYNLVGRNLKVKYRRSIFGFLWTLLNPLAMTTVFYLVFKVVMKVQVPHYLAFILTGLLPWTFFSQTMVEGMESIVGSLGLLSKVPIPFQLFPLVGSITNFITLALSLPILFAAALLTGCNLGISWVLLPFYFAALFVFTYMLSFVFGVFFVYFRDLRHLTGILLQVWFYATPVIYDDQMIPPQYRWILYANPLGTLFRGLHGIVVDGRWPTFLEMATTSAWTLAVFLFALLVYRKVWRDLVERI